jgi:fructosamine-3-kinase
VIKLIEEGLQFLGFHKTDVVISFHSQSCFPIYLINFTKENHKIAVKIVDRSDMAGVEVSGLKFLKDKNCPVPNIFGIFTKENKSLIYMEFISETFHSDKKEKLISSLNKLYSNTNSQWGFWEDNYIGPLLQKNSFHDSFDSFFWLDRIEPQLKLSQNNKIFSSEFSNRLERLLYKKTKEWNLNSSTPRLIHGDLWNGNILFSDKAYFIDPSISYSHPEQDFAMLDLFGSHFNIQDMENFLMSLGCSKNFKERIPFWQIYPLLVHVNLFGGSYIQRVKDVVRFYTLKSDACDTFYW